MGFFAGRLDAETTRNVSLWEENHQGGDAIMSYYLRKKKFSFIRAGPWPLVGDVEKGIKKKWPLVSINL